MDTDGGPPPVRLASEEEFVAVMRILEGALLDVAAERVRDALAADRALVAGDGRVVGALVGAPPDSVTVPGGVPAGADAHVLAVAVHPNYRRRGVGTALVDAASERWGRLSADCDPGVRPFYAALEFDLTERDGRLVGLR